MADTKPHTIPTEGDGVNYRGIVWFVVVLTVTTVVCQVLMVVLLKALQYQNPPQPVSPIAAAVAERPALEGRVYPTISAIGKPNGPQPQLLVNEPANLSTFRAREHESLTTYGWADKNTGVIRIPIERAKDLLISRGLPVRGAVKDVKEVKDVKQVKEVK